MQKFTIPWSAWYPIDGREELDLELPNHWDISLLSMKDVDCIEDIDQIKTALLNPFGVPPLSELAKGKKNAVIVVEDISRPTMVGPICEAVLDELTQAGIPQEKVTIILALGAHRPMNRADCLKKLGEKITNSVNIVNHQPFQNLVDLGESKVGTPIHVNKTYHEADLKISVSTVVPHPLAGFGGGAKIILPGVSGIETLEGNHTAGLKKGVGIGVGRTTELREDIEDVCGRVGLDFSINIVSTLNRGIAGVFAGHFVEAHRKAVELAQEVYKTLLPDLKPKERYEVFFVNLYPEDLELAQAVKGVNIVVGAQKVLSRKACVVYMGAFSEGRGYHALLGETGAPLYEKWGENFIFK